MINTGIIIFSTFLHQYLSGTVVIIPTPACTGMGMISDCTTASIIRTTPVTSVICLNGLLFRKCYMLSHIPKGLLLQVEYRSDVLSVI